MAQGRLSDRPRAAAIRPEPPHAAGPRRSGEESASARSPLRASASGPPPMSKTERVLAVLERLSSGELPPTHGELMRELGIQRSTLSDLLADLRRLGYIEMLDRRYVPGLRLLTFVQRAARQPGLSAGVRPLLETLAEITQETAIYVIQAGAAPRYVVSIDQVESPNPIRYVGQIGDPYPIDTTAAGRVFLAFERRLPEHPEQSSARRGAAADELEAELDRIRGRGFAVTGDEARSTAIAVPLHDSHRELLGVITIVGPTNRLRPREEEIANMVIAELERRVERMEFG